MQTLTLLTVVSKKLGSNSKISTKNLLIFQCDGSLEYLHLIAEHPERGLSAQRRLPLFTFTFNGAYIFMYYEVISKLLFTLFYTFVHSIKASKFEARLSSFRRLGSVT